MKDRIRKIRKQLDLTQREFSERIGIARGNIGAYEVGKNAPSDAVISLICREFDVNEEWLREGKGEMFLRKTRNQMITDFVGDLIEEPKSFKSRLIEGLSKLDASDWEDIERIVMKLLDKTEVSNEVSFVSLEKSIDEKVEDYRRQLELQEKAGAESSALRRNA